MAISQQVLEGLRDRHMNKCPSNAIVLDAPTGYLVNYALCAFQDPSGNVVSLETGKPRFSGDYTKDLREVFGPGALLLYGTGIFPWRINSAGETEVLLQERTEPTSMIGLFGGGFASPTESWRVCAEREARDEASITFNPADLNLLEVYSGFRHTTYYQRTGDIVCHGVIVSSINYNLCKLTYKEVNRAETKCKIWMTFPQIKEALSENRIFMNNTPILEDLVNGVIILK